MTVIGVDCICYLKAGIGLSISGLNISIELDAHCSEVHCSLGNELKHELG